MSKAEVGSIAWVDLTVANASQVKEFYGAVVGWKTSPVSMGDYDDYSLQTADSHTDVAGVCHAQGANAALPAQWLMYVKVADLGESIKQVKTLGGEVLTPIKKLSGSSQYVVIKDPAGAVCAIYEEYEE